MTAREVTGSAKALAYLFSGGHVIQVSARRTKAQRIAHRKELAESWSRAIMARLPWVAPSAPRPVAAFMKRASFDAAVRAAIAGKRMATKDFPFDRSETKRLVRDAGYRWKAVAKRLHAVGVGGCPPVTAAAVPEPALAPSASGRSPAAAAMADHSALCARCKLVGEIGLPSSALCSWGRTLALTVRRSRARRRRAS